MAESKGKYDFIIVGAGPVGLSLALGLARENLKILLIEKQQCLSEHSKAPGIWSRTLEIFENLGVVDQFLVKGKILSELRIWDANYNRKLIAFNLKELSFLTKYPFLLILSQSETEKILLNELKKFSNVSIKFSAELVSFEQTNESVEAHYSLGDCICVDHAFYLVGCDGAHSRVRDILGYKLEGLTFSMKAALADIKLPDNHEYNFPRLSNRDQLAIGIKISDELWRLILPYPENQSSYLDHRIQSSVLNLFGHEDYEIVWKSEFKLHDRISSGFLTGRVILAGDAAHLNSPVGGQGMNAGIQDSSYLKNFLLDAFKQNNPRLLSIYEENRRKTLRLGVNKFTGHLTKFIFISNGRMIKTLMKSGALALKIKLIRVRFLKKLMMLD